MKNISRKRLFLIIFLILIIFAAMVSGAVADRQLFRGSIGDGIGQIVDQKKIVKEENIVIDIAQKASPAVVTVSVETPRRRVLELSPFGGFRQRIEGGSEQDIGSGFIVDSKGLVITNKHVVSSEDTKYTVITQDGKEYEVQEIVRDPANDLAILKIDASNLPVVELGDSDGLQVGQFAIAIGTALGEFRHTVTTGVISGLGRGITAGSAFEGYVERLDNVIQTDAAINPGNSGGPLLNSSGKVIGVNVAVASGAQNIGFAIPINIVKDGLNEFAKSGAFASKPFLGVNYQMIPRQTALLNNVPQGALVVEVVQGSSAANAGLASEDIIVKFNGQILDENNDLASVISKYKTGDTVTLEIWREGQTLSLPVTLSAGEN